MPSKEITQALEGLESLKQHYTQTKHAFMPAPPDQGGAEGGMPPELQELFGAVEQLMQGFEEIGGAVQQHEEGLASIQAELDELKQQSAIIDTKLDMVGNFMSGGNPLDMLTGSR